MTPRSFTFLLCPVNDAVGVVIVILLCILLSFSLVNAQQQSLPPATIDSNIAAGLRTSLNRSSLANSGVSATTSLYHLHLFESLGLGSGFQEVAVAAASVCVAYNPATSTDLLEFTLDLIGSWMQATDGGATVTSARSASSATTASYTMVLASNSPTTRVLLTALVDNSVAGFSSKTALPGTVSGVVTVADDAAVASYIKANAGTVGFLPLARGDGLQCAYVRVQDPFTKETQALLPTLTEQSTTYISLSGVSISVTRGKAYPLVGSFIATVPKSTPCDSGRANAIVAGVKRMFTNPSTIATLRLWGMTEIDPLLRVAAFRGVVSKGGAADCSSTNRVPSGGSSAIESAAGAWVLEYFRAYTVFIDYLVSSSGTAQSQMKVRDIRIGGSDALFSDADRINYPNIKFVPAVAFAVSIVFNLPGISQLVLPRCIIPAIFNGSITTWDHSALAAANPTTKLPNAAIKIAVRSTRSGTTEIFTRGLYEIDKSCNGGDGKNSPVTSTWPYGSTFSTTSTGSMLTALRANPYTIGYAAAPAAREVAAAEAAVYDEREKRETFPEQSFVAAAMDDGVLNPVTFELDLFPTKDARAAANRATGGSGVVVEAEKTIDASLSWPFVGTTYFMYEDRLPEGNCSQMEDALKFALWVQQDSGARQLTINKGYVPITQKLVDACRARIRSATCGNAALFPEPEPENKLPLILGIAIPLLVLLVAGIIGVVWWYATKDKRSLRYAPTDPTKPITFIFTDIESSTGLWAAVPHIMGRMLDLHNKTIQASIDRCCGHNVKLIGDSVMIAFAEADDALKFCNDVQEQLMVADWDEEISGVYAELIDEAALYAMAPSAARQSRLDPELFRGLAVRFGIHTGTADVKKEHDLVDYFGSAVACAARIESAAHGGQICASDSFINALENGDKNSVLRTNFIVKQLGKHMLRGLPEPVPIVELLPLKYSRRVFPPLRLDVQTGPAADEDDSSTANDMHDLVGVSGSQLSSDLGHNSQSDADPTRPNTISGNRTTPTGSRVSAGGVGAGGTTAVSTVSGSKSTVESGVGGAAGNNSKHSATASGSKATTDDHSSEDKFIEYLRDKSDSQSTWRIAFVYEVTRVAMSTAPTREAREQILHLLLKHWRIDEVKSKAHREFRQQLGNEKYWLLRLAGRVSAVLRKQLRMTMLMGASVSRRHSTVAGESINSNNNNNAPATEGRRASVLAASMRSSGSSQSGGVMGTSGGGGTGAGGGTTGSLNMESVHASLHRSDSSGWNTAAVIAAQNAIASMTPPNANRDDSEFGANSSSTSNNNINLNLAHVRTPSNDPRSPPLLPGQPQQQQQQQQQGSSNNIGRPGSVLRVSPGDSAGTRTHTTSTSGGIESGGISSGGLLQLPPRSNIYLHSRDPSTLSGQSG